MGVLYRAKETSKPLGRHIFRIVAKKRSGMLSECAFDSGKQWHRGGGKGGLRQAVFLRTVSSGPGAMGRLSTLGGMGCRFPLSQCVDAH